MINPITDLPCNSTLRIYEIPFEEGENYGSVDMQTLQPPEYP